jgi:hypothetical protein
VSKAPDDNQPDDNDRLMAGETELDLFEGTRPWTDDDQRDDNDRLMAGEKLDPLDDLVPAEEAPSEPGRYPPIEEGHRPPPPDPFESSWRTLGEWQAGEDWLEQPPPARRWLLRQSDRAPGGPGDGVFPLGKAGLLVAAGGAGKTMALAQLALAVALPDEAHERHGARFAWFGGLQGSSAIPGGLRVATRGRVLLILAEEDIEEMRRRLFSAWRLYGGLHAQGEEASRWRRSLAERLVLVPGSGNPRLAMTTPAEMGEVLSETARTLRRRLDASEEGWALIIADPLSRFAGADAEKDNRAATTLIQAFESLLEAPGQPSVLVAHHTSQAARSAQGELDAVNARGVTALSDGIRWQCELRPRPLLEGAPELVEWGVTKTNYAPSKARLTLCRTEGGALRVASAEEKEGYREAELKLAEERAERKAEQKAAEKRGQQRASASEAA